MHIFLRELKGNFKAFIFWSLGLFALMYAGMMKYTGLVTDAAGVSKLFAAWPKIIVAAFGMAGLDFATLKGYYGVLFLYAVIVIALYAVILGAKTTVGDLNDGIGDFVYAKPLPRWTILISKQLAAVVILAVFSLLSYLFSVMAIQAMNLPNTINNELILLNISLFIIGLIYLSLSTLCCAISRQRGALIANLLFLFHYILAIVYDVATSGQELIRPFTPIKYFDIPSVLSSGELNMGYLVTSIILIVLMTAGAYRLMSIKDL